MSALDDARDYLKRLQGGFTDAVGEGREDHRNALKRGRSAQGLDDDAARIDQMFGSNRTITLINELLGRSEPEQIAARNKMGLGLSSDRATKQGQILGTLAGDAIQDRGREVWWLLNAPQASANVIQEMLLKKHAPDLYKTDPLFVDKKEKLNEDGTIPVYKEDGQNRVRMKKPASAVGAGIAYNEGPDTYTKKDYYKEKGGYTQRRHRAGHVDALAIPAGIAVNNSLGLLNPFGGYEGYEAVVPDQEDKTKTANVLAEVGVKYLLGRTGNLLPWDEFKQVRPDVSKDEYMRYKAFKFDKNMDFNPLDDGQVTLPVGVGKFTDEGIHGPEVQFMGRSLPVTTGLLPTAAAIAGTTLGARRGGVRGGLKYGLGSTVGGILGGNLLEQERRRRNAAENELDRIVE